MTTRNPHTMTDQAYRWFWKTKLPERRGQLFRVICRGAMNSCLIEFEDGWRAVTSRNALRKADGGHPGATPNQDDRSVTHE